MNVDIDYAAREAVYGLQLSVEKAIAFVVRTEHVDRKTAQAAVEKCLRNMANAH
jgi:hypothetical protein